MTRLCLICNRPAWDGGSALRDTECSERDSLLCKTLEVLRHIVDLHEEKRALNPSEEHTWRMARSVLVLAGLS